MTACVMAGCGGPPPTADAVPAEASGYVQPPSVTEAAPGAGALALAGVAPPKAQVRLSAPAGGVISTRADANGRWRLQLPLDPQARIFGVSAENDGRRVQAEAYLLVGPRGETALLRAGAGALRLDRPSGSRIAALDFDADGGALVSGWAPAGTDVAVRLDGRSLGETRADEDGRFSYALPRLAFGARRIETTGAGFTDQVQVEVSAPAPLTDGPLRASPIARGLRADWLTPGGGVQSTVLAG